jgi:hypothetical protein
VNKIDLSRAVWRKSSRSNGQAECLEVARFSSAVAVRDSKNPNGGALVVTPAEWAMFVDDVKNDAFTQA